MPKIYLILLFALAIRLWMALDHSYIHEWDERYHALVAKNLVQHPLKPTLYDTPLLPYDYREWALNHVWLSKPVLPLWLMAISIKCWGATEWALRFPSLILGVLCVFLTYRIALPLYGRKVALWAAFFHASHGLLLDIGAGRYSSDHVDAVFLFWMELGFWLMLEYFKKPGPAYSLQGAVLIGLAGGVAFMSKWTAAFMLPIVWGGVAIATDKTLRLNRIRDGLVILFLWLLVSLPWLLYILNHFPKEAVFTLFGVLAPVQETIQGHGGNWYFYLETVGGAFGQLIYIPLIWLLFQVLRGFRRSRSSFSSLLLFVWIALPLLLLSMAATKRANYLLPLAPAFFVLTGLFMRIMALYVRKNKTYA